MGAAAIWNQGALSPVGAMMHLEVSSNFRRGVCEPSSATHTHTHTNTSPLKFVYCCRCRWDQGSTLYAAVYISLATCFLKKSTRGDASLNSILQYMYTSIHTWSNLSAQNLLAFHCLQGWFQSATTASMCLSRSNPPIFLACHLAIEETPIWMECHALCTPWWQSSRWNPARYGPMKHIPQHRLWLLES